MKNEAESLKLVAEQMSVVYELFERKAKGFRRALQWVVGLSLIFFVFVFYPYVSLRGDRYRIDKNLAELTSNISESATKKRENLNAEKLLFNLKTQVGNEARFPMAELQKEMNEHDRLIEELRRALSNDSEAQAWASGRVERPVFSNGFYEKHPDLIYAKGDSCFWLAGDLWRRCRVAQQVGSVHDNAVSTMSSRELSPDQIALLDPLRIDLDKLSKSFDGWLAGRLPDWKEGRKSESGSLAGELGEFWGDYLTLLEKRSHALEEERKAISNTQRQLEEEQEKLVNRKADVNAKLNEVSRFQRISTPLGELPIGLDELILIFPALLASGFLLCAAILIEMIQLRRVFWDLCRRKDAAQEVLSDRYVTLVAPLWLDPAEPKLRRTAKFAAFALPFWVFVIAIALLFYNRLLLDNFPESARLSIGIYLIIYVLSFGAFVYPCLRIIGEFRCQPANGTNVDSDVAEDREVPGADDPGEKV
jgi:hypothetical protein